MTLVDGLALLGTGHHDDTLTDCACWRVDFDGYSFQPHVVVPFETGLNDVEALARRKLFEELTKYGPAGNESPEDYAARYTTDVVSRRVVRVERCADVTLDVRLG